jgi:hypothetical protein
MNDRTQIILLINQAMTAGASKAKACQLICLSERTLQRWQARSDGDARPHRIQNPVNQLTLLEQERMLEIANSEEYGHLPPSQIVPRLADEGCYIASESSFYRLLKKHQQMQYRGSQRPPHKRALPRALSATTPRQLFSWDITYLPTNIRGSYFYLYLFLDIYSRKIVGWQVYANESSELASLLFQDICLQEQIAPGQVILHSDNGGPMKGSTMLGMLQNLGVTPSFSRPAVSNDNPYSESLFKTMKYRSNYAGIVFADILQARQWVGQFVVWYNSEHRHSAIRFVTPNERHAGGDVSILKQRASLYEAAKSRNPRRWSTTTRNWMPVSEVYLNPQTNKTERSDSSNNNPIISKEVRKKVTHVSHVANK